MALSRFRQGLGRLAENLPEMLFPVPPEITAGASPETVDALRRQATMQLGLGLMAARERGMGLGGGISAALQQSQHGLGSGLRQIYAARRDQRQEQRQDTHDERLARAEERDLENTAWDRGFREKSFAAGETDREFNRGIDTARLKLAQLGSGPQGSWGQPFEAIDPMSGEPGMFQSNSLSGQIRPAAIGGKGLGPKLDRGNESGVSAENAIYRQVVGAFGGTFDPVTGSIVGLDKDQASRVQGIAARASRDYVDGAGNLTIAESVNRAMQDRINEKPAPATAPSGGLPPAAAARLKEGVVTSFANGQRWTVRNGQPVQVK